MFTDSLNGLGLAITIGEKMKLLTFPLMLFALSLQAQEVKVNKDGSVTLTLSAAEAKACKDGGGCVVMPVSELEPIIREAAQNLCGKKWTI
jgi:hypothetical protein